MNVLLNSSQISFLSLVKRFFAIFGPLCAFTASLAVLGNDTYYLAHHGLTPSIALFLLAFGIGLISQVWGLAMVAALLPLTAGIPNLLNTLFGVSALAMPNPGLDLVAGLLLAYFFKEIVSKVRQNPPGQNDVNYLSVTSPWPVNLVILVITFSVMLAITRNVYLSATSTSFRGVLFNLIHFRPIDWHADYLPMGNWVAYAIAAGVIFLVIGNLKQFEPEQRNQWIFRPLILGLVISAIAGLMQAVTGWGLPESQLQFRKDAFGYAAMGMQPDLHAFAAHMLLGVVGLWGYFLVCKNRIEKLFIVLTFLLCTAGLIASKSRASLLIALITLAALGLIYLYRSSKKFFVISLIAFLVAIPLLLLGAGTIPGLAWVGELLSQMQSRRLDSLSDLGGMMGSRFEIWSAVANMFSAYPLMGVGEGEFYRLSSNVSFARSEFLQLNRGENAHNYFLQVLAENGLVGIAAFAIAFIIPYRSCRNKQLVLPACIGLLSLFLGNIFAHSFLVRENLLLGAFLLGLIYCCSDKGPESMTNSIMALTRSKRQMIYSTVVVFLVGVAIEVASSFGRLPFLKGADCFIKDMPSYPDGWTSGAWEERLPDNIRSLELVAKSNHIRNSSESLIMHLELLAWIPGRGKVPISTKVFPWTSEEFKILKVNVPPEYYDSPYIISARLQLSSCYTPRNLGINTDSRRLGIQIKHLSWK